MRFSNLYRFFLVFFSLQLGSSLAGQENEATIPVVDMADFHNPKRHQVFVEDLSQAFQHWGFVAVKNPGLDVSALDRAYETARHFFAQSEAVKMEMYNKELSGQRGYTPGETAKGSDVKDFKEFFSVTLDYSDVQLGRQGYPANIWPQSIDIKTSMNELTGMLHKHGSCIEQAMAEALGLQSDYFQQLLDEGDVLLRGIHYFSNPPKGAPWAAAHVDSNLYTILPRATGRGLQVLNPNGVWVDVVVPPDAVIINCGEMLQNITNGYFKSCMHRVVAAHAGEDRYVYVMFRHPKPNDRLDPLPQCIALTGGKALYPKGTQRELLYERLIDGGIAGDAMVKYIGESGIVERMLDLNRASPRVMETLKEHGCASPKVLSSLHEMS